ncbi:hypothetical protein DFH07DRAFT_128455 [Mycena maculata]|uniref:Uncharacterized protein n=1 Tax=Mycena maculata TaxID=230809 RepID=A0AAD7I3W9_9AGAR|nr:hypothetical protein DFH07DRAFT_128455 [Mycena maculata]
MISFPQELLDAIVDEINDASTLASCALAAKPLLLPCQRKIFRSLHLVSHEPRKPRMRGALNFTEAHALFTGAPHLGSYVRNLTIQVPVALTDLPGWNLALHSAQNVERLVVYEAASSMPRSILPPETMTSLVEFLASPSLGRLHLAEVRNVPSALISAAMLIPVVSFIHVRLKQEDPLIPTQLHSSTSVPRLRDLTIMFSTPLPGPCDFLLHPRHPPYTSHIERLEIRLTPRGDQRLLTACAATLKYLVLDAILDTSINIPHLPLVCDVKIEVSVDEDWRLPASLPPILSQIPTSLPAVETITLVFVSDRRFRNVAWIGDHLPIFGPSFTTCRELLHLRRVHCELVQHIGIYAVSKHTLFDGFVQAVETSMPGLEGTGILTCTLAAPFPSSYIDRLP